MTTEPLTLTGTFTVAEYTADAARVADYALKHGTARVLREDGSVRVVISIPPADVGGDALTDAEIEAWLRLSEANETEWDEDDHRCPACGEPLSLAPEMEPRGVCGECSEEMMGILPRALAGLREVRRERDEFAFVLRGGHAEGCNIHWPIDGECSCGGNAIIERVKARLKETP